MSDSNIDEIKRAFSDLSVFHVKNAPTLKHDQGVLEIDPNCEKKGGKVVIAFDTIGKFRDVSEGERTLDAMAKLLEAQGIENIRVTSLTARGVDAETESAFTYTSGAKIVVEVPDAHDSVLKIKAAYREDVIQKATGQITDGITKATRLVTGLLGEQESAQVMKDILQRAGIAAGQKSAAK